MKLENQVCTKKQAIRLKELGIKQESHFYWDEHPLESVTIMAYYKKDFSYEIVASAFNVAELGAMLAAGIVQDYKEKPKYGIQINKCPQWLDNDRKWIIYLAGDSHYTMSDNEAECRANMLIYLLENNHITPEEVNQRLLNS